MIAAEFWGVKASGRTVWTR